MKKDLYNELMAKFLSGDISEAEKANLQDWMKEDAQNQDDFDASKKIWNDAKSNEFEVDTEAAWGKFEGKMAWDEVETPAPVTESAKVVKMSPFKQLLRIAAVLLIAGGAAIWLFQNSGLTGNPNLATIETTENERIEVALPDGSKVWLNERSTISYSKAFASRNVTLVGEAFFDIERDENRPFRIQAGKTETKVLGTSFNIRAYPEESSVEVAVSSGKVSFSENIAQHKALILTKGDKGVLNKKEWTLEKAENMNALSWRDGQLVFENATLNEIIEDLERHYDLTINTTNPTILNCRFTGSFNKADLKEVIDALSFALEINATPSQGNYSFDGKGCE